MLNEIGQSITKMVTHLNIKSYILLYVYEGERLQLHVFFCFLFFKLTQRRQLLVSACFPGSPSPKWGLLLKERVSLLLRQQKLVSIEKGNKKDKRP